MPNHNNKTVFSGIKPTGDLHLGNYIGAISNWVKPQDDFNNIFCVVDLHAITVKQDPKLLKKRTYETAGLLLAAGIDKRKSALFVQSHILEHTKLAWILNCFSPMGWMKKMTQFKEKSDELKEKVTVGLFDYPALMAADILLYDTDVVPVGADQRQHVELARDIAKRFNLIYGNIFTIPEADIGEEGSRIKGLSDPTKKMSKGNGESENNTINLLDTPDEIESKIKSATTDSENKIVFNESRPGVYNLLTIYEAFSGMLRDEIEKKFEGKNYVEFKKDLAEVVVEGLRPLQEKYREITKDENYITGALKEGVEKVRPLAEKKMKQIEEAIGLG